ncbi:hypothetical protein KEM54_004390 [Ascosphaera aggregata]|nr:hypothetical protein KEM54_004390 [Ascosphaera aggregata]
MTVLEEKMSKLDVNDQSDTIQVATQNVAPVNNMNAEAAARAREHGWAEPQQYDYQKYQQPHHIQPAAASIKPTVDATTGYCVNAIATSDAGTAAANSGGDNATVNVNEDDDDEFPLWASSAAKYEWKEEYGDVGPRNEALEKILFHSDLISRAGTAFERLREIKVTAETTEQPDPIAGFETAGLHPVMLENIRLCRYTVPTPIQAYSIPAVLTNHDLIAVAQTGKYYLPEDHLGSGKTAAFLIPILSKLMGKARKLAAPRPNLANGFDETVDAVRAEPLVLIIAPTRELSTQIFDEARRLCYRSMLRPCVIYGGAPVREQRIELQKGCDVLIGTPGRLLDFMGKPHILSLRRVRYTVIDEADEMLQPDWEEDFTKLMSGGDLNEDADHNYLMFSATFNKQCRELARKFLAADHVRIRIGRAGSAHLNVTQRIVYAEEHMKKQCLYDLLLAMPPARTLVFVNTKQQADFLDDYLFNMGLPSTSIHSDRTQREREDALRAFRTAKCPIMVATGVSARGLDIKNVLHVVNFDLPSMMHGGTDEYVHRIGRTARIGNVGMATSLYNHERNSDIAPELVKILLECNQEIPDFLENDRPADGKLVFHDDTDDEEEEAAAHGDVAATGAADAAEDSWSAPHADAPAAVADSGNEWGAPASAPAPAPINDGGWNYSCRC